MATYHHVSSISILVLLAMGSDNIIMTMHTSVVFSENVTLLFTDALTRARGRDDAREQHANRVCSEATTGPPLRLSSLLCHLIHVVYARQVRQVSTSVSHGTYQAKACPHASGYHPEGLNSLGYGILQVRCQHVRPQSHWMTCADGLTSLCTGFSSSGECTPLMISTWSRNTARLCSSPKIWRLRTTSRSASIPPLTTRPRN